MAWQQGTVDTGEFVFDRREIEIFSDGKEFRNATNLFHKKTYENIWQRKNRKFISFHSVNSKWTCVPGNTCYYSKTKTALASNLRQTIYGKFDSASVGHARHAYSNSRLFDDEPLSSSINDRMPTPYQFLIKRSNLNVFIGTIRSRRRRRKKEVNSRRFPNQEQFVARTIPNSIKAWISSLRKSNINITLNNSNIINEAAASCARPSSCVSTMIVQTLCDCCVRLSLSLSLSDSLCPPLSSMTQCTEFCEKWNGFWECDGYDVDGFFVVWISTSNRAQHIRKHTHEKIIKSECKHMIGTASVRDQRHSLPAKIYAAISVSIDPARSTLKRRNDRSRFCIRNKRATTASLPIRNPFLSVSIALYSMAMTKRHCFHSIKCKQINGRDYSPIVESLM